MSSAITNIIHSIEQQNISVREWLFGFAGIVFIRCLLEALSSRSSSGIIASDAATLVHYSLFYFTTCIGLICILYLSTKNRNIHKLGLYGMMIIWFAPLFDLISTHGDGAQMFYFFENGGQLVHQFLTFFLPHTNEGITHGIRVEIAIILFSIGWYLHSLRKSIATIATTIIVSFIFICSMLGLPGMLYTISHVYTSDAPRSITIDFIGRSIMESNIQNNMLHGTLTTTTARNFELGFNALLSQVLVVMACVLTMLFFWKKEPEKCKAILVNSRPERVLFYLALLVLGMEGAFVHNLGALSSWVDILSATVLMLSWYGAWMFAVHVNDITDERIDTISNPTRPVITKKITPAEMQGSGLIWLTLSLIGSFSVGYYPFFMNLVFTAAYYIYSAHPLRLKRVPILSSFLISIACVSTIMAGFFFVSDTKLFATFPATTALWLLLIYTLAVNVRDIKDIEGDKADGIYTLPIIFGRNGVKVTGLLFAISFLIAPLAVSSYTLYYIAIPASIAGYISVTRSPYREQYVFYTFFVFAALFSILYRFFS